jgi:SET domain-containing protein
MSAASWAVPVGNPHGRPDHTDEASFLLRPCAHGIGVFAAHEISQGTYLRLYRSLEADPPRKVRRTEVPGEFIKYCLDLDNEYVMRPNDFGHMEIVWFLNHSDQPNARHEAHRYYALRDIAAGDEITIDYGTL